MSLEGWKTCTKCKCHRPSEKFSKDSTKADGLCSVCKSCKRKYDNQSDRAFKRAVQKNTVGVTLDHYTKVHQAPCVCCGEEPAYGVDRINPEYGYMPDNIQSMCWLCNQMKSTLHQETFMSHIEKIRKFRKGEK